MKGQFQLASLQPVILFPDQEADQKKEGKSASIQLRYTEHKRASTKSPKPILNSSKTASPIKSPVCFRSQRHCDLEFRKNQG